MSFPHLLGPGNIGSLALRNRIAMCPMGTNLAETDGTVGDAQSAWFEARARGGAGLILVGSMGVAYPSGAYDARQIAVSDDAQLPGLQRMVDAVHSHGAAIAAQLVHDGGNSLFDIASGRPVLVPSHRRFPTPDDLSTMVTADEGAAMLAPFTTPGSRYEQREADDTDLAWVIERFVDAADRARRAGFDGIELHAGHGYLLDAFLSPATNRRDDQWGGAIEQRARLFVEVTRAVRGHLGPDFPLWARVNAVEHHRDPGQQFADAVTAMAMAVEVGLDAVHVTAYAEPTVATGITDAHTPHRPGALIELAGEVRRRLGVPVIAFGRLTPEDAERALADGAADIIAMGRPLIADPDLPNKLAAGRRHDVRPCAYQYRCIGAIFLGDPVSCAVNPEAGRESETAAAPPSGRRVVVAGGGPAGLEVARRLAQRGHAVELWEAGDRLGGRLALAGAANPDLAGLTDWLAGAAIDAGVAVHLDRAATAEDAVAAGAEVLIVATGAAWSPSVPGVLGVDDLRAWLDGDEALVGTRVAIVGAGAGTVTLALHAAGRGRTVSLVAPTAVLAPELGLPGRFRRVADCRAAGVAIVLSAPATSIEPTSVRWDGGAVDVDTVIVVQPGAREPMAAGALECHVIGDASGFGGLAAALRAAADLAVLL